MPTTPVVIVDSGQLRLKFITTETPLDLLPNFDVDPINTPLLTPSMLGKITVSTPMVVIHASND